jgi:hypothetical protein
MAVSDVEVSSPKLDQSTAVPVGYQSLIGNLTYSVYGLELGQTVELHFALPSGAKPTMLMKPLPNGQFLNLTELAEFSSNSIRLTITDGGLGDQDGIANGTIIDPIMFLTKLPAQPSAPRSLAVSKLTSKSLTLSWSPPSSNGGATITKYKIEVSTDNGVSWKSHSHLASKKLLFTLSSLSPGTSYRFRVSASTSRITGSVSKIVSVRTPASIPSAPRSFVASGVSKSGASLRWESPSISGGASIVGYQVEISRDNGKSWRWVNNKLSTRTTLTLSGLSSGTSYLVRVSAQNSKGFGPITQTRFKTGTIKPSLPR